MDSSECIQRFEFEDENCQENTETSCNDGKDNDGNGVWDCDNVTSQEDPDNVHSADPNCCPMTVDDNGICRISDQALKSCPGMNLTSGVYSDACLAARVS